MEAHQHPERTTLRGERLGELPRTTNTGFRSSRTFNHVAGLHEPPEPARFPEAHNFPEAQQKAVVQLF